jgi:hypothetical protein
MTAEGDGQHRPATQTASLLAQLFLTQQRAARSARVASPYQDEMFSLCPV